jgi:hypothetical protein
MSRPQKILAETDITRYSKTETFAVVEIDVPQIGNDDVLVHTLNFTFTEVTGLTPPQRSRSRRVESAEQICITIKESFLPRYGFRLTLLRIQSDYPNSGRSSPVRQSK